MSCARLGVSVVILTIALAGCGGGDGAMKLTLRDDECVYEGATSRDAGSFTIDVKNESNRFGHVAVATLVRGATAADIQPFLDAAWHEFRRTGESLPPPWETVSVDRAIPGDERVLEFDGKAGSYLLLCLVDTDQDFGQDEPEDVPPAEVHLAAELQVHAR